MVATIDDGKGKPQTVEFDRVISAVGVVGNIENLGLEKLGVKTERGCIVIDGYGKTNVPGIYAIGDVAGPPMLAHKAEHEGVVCVEAIKGMHPHPMDKLLIPGCTYCHPQIASVGLTEAKAKEGGREIRVGRFPFVGNGKAIALGEDQGMVKVIFDKKTGQLLGAHMVGAEVTELIQGYVVAMNLETTEEELMHTVFPHPTIVGNDEGSGAGCLWPRAEHVGTIPEPRTWSGGKCRFSDRVEANNQTSEIRSVKDNDNLTIERPTFVTHLECAMEGDHYPADQIHNLSKAGKPLLVRYDLAGVKKALTKDALAQRPADLWRYRELLPVRKVSDIVSLGEVTTPLIRLPKLAKKIGGGEIIVKDEGRLPTGSFKARGLVMAVSMGKALGIKHMAMPTNGNAGAALAAYATSCGIKTTIFCPADTPEVNVSEIELQGATVYRVNGLIDDCGKIVGEGKAKAGWFDTSTLKEPYRIEGKKTMGLELAEQLGWDVPDVIFYPTGGGTGLIGMWKAFAELEAIGFIGSKRPRMVAVQAAGCAPMVRAFENGTEHAPRWEDAHTIASGIRVPQAVGDFLILRAVRESKGFAIAVPDDKISAALNEVAREEGLLLCPEGAATYAAYKQSLADGRVTKDDRVMLFNCATGLKYPLPPVTRTLDRHQPIDYAKL